MIITYEHRYYSQEFLAYDMLRQQTTMNGMEIAVLKELSLKSHSMVDQTRIKKLQPG